MTREGGARIREEGRGAIWQKNDSRGASAPAPLSSSLPRCRQRCARFVINRVLEGVRL
jgi:hypothetical protein